MCGIVGFNWEDRELIKKSVYLIKYRGPDDRGIFIENGFSLGHCRLSYLDLSKRGKQPMLDNEGSLCITFNGEIYNFREIRKDLEGKYKFKTNTDTEVILYAYKEYGSECVRLFRGMFAFVILNIKNKTLFLARDPFGIKPLYYYFDGKNFVFASEIKAITINPLVKKELCREAVGKYLAYKYTPDEFTLLRNIKKILPGETLTFSDNKLIKNRYYDQEENIINKNIEHLSKHLADTIEDSVKSHMVADVEVGSFLSGGIDSSVLSAFAQKLMKRDKRNLKTFSIYFDYFSEKEYSSAVAEHLGTDHYSVYVNIKDVIKHLPKVMWHSDEPMTDFAAIPNFLLSRFARKKVKTVLAGQGADEVFGGYEHYTKMCNLLKGGKVLLSNKLRKVYHKAHKMLPESRISRSFEALSNAESAASIYLRTYSVFKKYEINKTDLLHPLDNINIEKFREPLNKFLYADQKILVGEYFNMVADKMTMANSLEERVPYLDKKVVNFSFAIPAKFKINKDNEKIILKKVGSKILPNITIKRKKQGYGAPYFEWIKKELGEIVISRMEKPLICKHNIIDPNFVKKQIERIKNSQSDSLRAWMLYSLERWYEEYFIKEKPTFSRI